MPLSPEKIAGHMLDDGVSPVRVCTETICRFIYGRKSRRWNFIGI
ncbi:hypothetical protein LPJGGPFB_04848 [Ensifer adhaerens]|nr:hypothetical protein [Ensifer adhaerens]